MAAGEAKAHGWWQKGGKTFLLLFVFFILALFIRSYFNYEASYNGGDYRWSGTDAYYHMRVVDHLRETGEFLLMDPLINYPIGAINPRPPLFDWMIAAVGGLLAPLFNGDSEASTNAVAAFSPAVWGALTVFPMYFLGKEAFGRRAGYWAAFFIAIMAAHITRSNLGAVDHDATILFFFTLGAWAFVKALKTLKRGIYIDDWRKSSTIGPGFKRVFTDNRASIAYAALAGAAFAGIALTWKGYTYAFGVFAVWYGFQLLANHLRRVDNTPYFVLAMVTFLVTLVMIWPYYSVVERLDSAVFPTVYILIGVLAASLVFVPTRHLPPVLVIPSTIGVAVVGLLVMLIVLPEIGRLFFTGLGYFVQTKLYSTIAEAQRTPLGYLVFSMGIVPFFFALAGIFFAIASFVKKRRDDHLFVLVWAAVALLMAFTATRFVFNASVGFAVLAGWVTERFIRWIRFGEVAKSWTSLRRAGTGFFKNTRQSVGVRHVLAALFIVFVLLLPNVWMGVDAGVPAEYVFQQTRDLEPDDPQREFWGKWFGAFGQDFLSSDWIAALGYLSDQDRDLAPEDRPAFMAWWDYGFYAVQRGDHPTVADPFQFGYQISGRVLASQTEAEAITFFTIRLLEGNVIRGQTGGQLDPDVAAVLNDRSPGLAEEIAPELRLAHYDSVYRSITESLTEDGATGPDLQAVVSLYRDVRAATGDSVRYLTLDSRMFPCDDPRNPGIESGSIFYAPVFLADKNPEEFVRTKYTDAQGQEYFQKVYETTADGGSRAVENPHVVDSAGNKYLLGGPVLYPMGENGYIDYDHRLAATGIQLGGQPSLEYDESFYNTLLYRAWIGPAPQNLEDKVPPPSQYAPGQGLKHFRLVFSTVDVPQNENINRCSYYGIAGGVVVLKYFDGAEVTTTVRDSNGDVLQGAVVEVVDNFGIVHDSAPVDANGTATVLAPFSNEEDPSDRATQTAGGTLRGTGPNQIRVTVNGVVVTSENFTVTEAQAMRQEGAPAIAPFELTVELGNLEGMVFHDRDGNGRFDAANDTALANATVAVGDDTVSTDNQGRYAFTGIAPGGRSVRASFEGFSNATRQVQVPSGGSATADLAMTPAPVAVNGTLLHNGEPVPTATVTFQPQGENTTLAPKSATADAGGNYTTTLAPGTWQATVNYTATEDSVNVRYYTQTPVEIVVAIGDAPKSINIQLSREELAS